MSTIDQTQKEIILSSENSEEVAGDLYLKAAKIKRGIENLINSYSSSSSQAVNVIDNQEEKEIAQQENLLLCKHRQIIRELNQIKLDKFSLQQENNSLKKINDEASSKLTEQEKKIESLTKLCEVEKNQNELLSKEKERISRDSKSFHQYLQSLKENEKLLNQNQTILDAKKKSLETSFVQAEKDHSELLLIVKSKDKEIKTLVSKVNVLVNDNQELKDEIGKNF